MTHTQKRALTGLRATGNLHLGNYLGAIKPAIDFSHTNQGIYFIADMHALTSHREPGTLHSHTLDHLATWMALGLDLSENVIFRQSDRPETAELAWYLSCVTNMGLLEKGHAYKDKLASGESVNHGVFSYPVLMAADILLYEPDLVPVGKDQSQHVEMARDIAGSFNATFGETFKLPELVVREDVMTIPGLDGRKMSKSYNNEIPLFADEKQLRKLIMSIKTDSTGLEEPKQLSGTLVGDLFKLFSTSANYTDLEARLARGGMGWGHAKDELFQVINSYITEPRARYREIRGDEATLLKTLADGAERAKSIATPVLKRVRHAIGIR
ncbi:MAG: tryptophan--tRNA ligase [Pseudomonadota bacterium]